MGGNLERLILKLTALKPLVKTANTSRIPPEQHGWRGSPMTSAQRGYDYQWQKKRAAHLMANPLCVYCQAETPPRVTAATVVDHKIPHRGDKTLFNDRNNWQSLCATHHSRDKQKEEQAL